MRDDALAAQARSDSEVFLGSTQLMDALHDTAAEHVSMTEIPDDGDPYIWCLCGWHSDDECHWRNAQASFLVHLSNALHTAAVKALQPVVVRRMGVRP